MSYEDINNFAIKKNIYLSSNELVFIYNFIKDNYLDIIDNPNNFDLKDYKDNFTKDNYEKINKLINEYKKRTY